MPTRRHGSPFDRPRWTEQDAREALDAPARSGQSIAAFAAEHGLDPQRLYAWRRRLGNAESIRLWWQECVREGACGTAECRGSSHFHGSAACTTGIRERRRRRANRIAIARSSRCRDRPCARQHVPVGLHVPQSHAFERHPGRQAGNPGLALPPMTGTSPRQPGFGRWRLVNLTRSGRSVRIVAPRGRVQRASHEGVRPSCSGELRTSHDGLDSSNHRQGSP